jgi:hypothetical protein
VPVAALLGDLRDLLPRRPERPHVLGTRVPERLRRESRERSAMRLDVYLLDRGTAGPVMRRTRRRPRDAGDEAVPRGRSDDARGVRLVDDGSRAASATVCPGVMPDEAVA